VDNRGHAYITGEFGAFTGQAVTFGLGEPNETTFLNAGGRDIFVAKYAEPLHPPTITSLTATPAVLWPPNHKMVPVLVAASASDGSPVAPVCQITAISSNESGTAPGQADWVITGPLTVNLRAERAGSGTGRTYSISVTCTNASQLSDTKDVIVTVPHDHRK
jgi:hypothetical protein